MIGWCRSTKGLVFLTQFSTNLKGYPASKLHGMDWGLCCHFITAYILSLPNPFSFTHSQVLTHKVQPNKLPTSNCPFYSLVLEEPDLWHISYGTIIFFIPLLNLSEIKTNTIFKKLQLPHRKVWNIVDYKDMNIVFIHLLNQYVLRTYIKHCSRQLVYSAKWGKHKMAF